ncbi:DUF2867 domain-containing protein [Tardiphaga sp. 768_D3_N2_1]|uniref:DUF2867 domain-containing protein n=1 Tax=Tardiphaga sp. 768_D3_N2_1 TaxID=3240783 RepID=UPI003F8BF9A2
MTVSMVHPTIDTNSLLSGAQFADAFSISIATNLTAREAAERMLSRSPRWVDALMRLRDLIVAPFGLKTAHSARQADIDKVGFFPVLSQTPQRLVAGFNDNHLDFRVVIDVAAEGAGQRVTATTVVLMHNWLGRIYLAVIKPFHRMVVRSMLQQVTR